MRRIPRGRATVIGLAFLLALGCAGCGKRGALDPPPDVSAPSAGATPAPAQSAQKISRRKKTPITPPKTPFILDPLV